MGAVYSTGSINENPLIFKGEPVETQDEVEEGAAQAALNYICENYAIAINDYNYSMLQATKQKLLSAKRKYVQSIGNLTWLNVKLLLAKPSL